MKVAKIIIQGPNKSYKTTLAQLIKKALEKDFIAVKLNDVDNDRRFLWENRVANLADVANIEAVEIEVKTINREVADAPAGCMVRES